MERCIPYVCATARPHANFQFCKLQCYKLQACRGFWVITRQSITMQGKPSCLGRESTSGSSRSRTRRHGSDRGA